MPNWVMITGSITSRPLYPRKIDPRYPLNRRILEQVCMFWVKFCCPCWVQNPASPISQSRHFNDSTILAPNNIYLYIYIYIYIYLIQKLLSSQTVRTSVLFSKWPTFTSLPIGHYSSWRHRFTLLLGVNVKTLVLQASSNYKKLYAVLSYLGPFTFCTCILICLVSIIASFKLSYV